MFRLLCSIVALGTLLTAQAAAQRAKPATSSPEAKAGGLVNLNTASVAELEVLPGIGAKTAARIVDYREKKGPFKKVEELMNVQGIGEKSFLKLKPQLTVSAKPEPATASAPPPQP
jgi:competence protein ComEA